MEQSRWRREERAYGCINVPRVHIYTYIYIYISTVHICLTRVDREGTGVAASKRAALASIIPSRRVIAWILDTLVID